MSSRASIADAEVHGILRFRAPFPLS